MKRIATLMTLVAAMAAASHAGTLLVQEAGGTVTGLAGEPLVFNQPSPLRPGMIASNGVLHDGLRTLIARVGTPGGR